MISDTKTALLDAAEQSARSRGFDGFSYADLSAAVGIRKASIHYHFPTKADLSAALMARYATTIAGLCEEITAHNKTAAGRLRAVITLYQAALHEGEMVCLCVALTASHPSLSAQVHGQIAQFRSAMIRWLAEVFALGQADGTIKGVADPDDEAHACLALLEGAHLAARAVEDVAMFDRAVEVLRGRC